MGRAERRREEKLLKKSKKVKIPKTTVSQFDLMKMKNEIVESVATYYLENLYTCFAYVLHQDFGFGKKRIEKGLRSVDVLFNMISEGKITLDKVTQHLFDDCDVTITFEDGTQENMNEE